MKKEDAKMAREIRLERFVIFAAARQKSEQLKLETWIHLWLEYLPKLSPFTFTFRTGKGNSRPRNGIVSMANVRAMKFIILCSATVASSGSTRVKVLPMPAFIRIASK